MVKIYADLEYYKEEYLIGRQAVIPDNDFPFYEKRARGFIDTFTMNRIRVNNILEEIKQCICELAEYCYINEGSENKNSESIAGRSVTYKHGQEYRITERHLFKTGLLYRGAR